MAGLTMKSTSKPRLLRPSPNELLESVKQEKDKWRIFRIQQVREQARQEAQRVREAVRRQERRLLDDLQHEVEVKWQMKKENRVIQLEEEYQACLNNIGQAHRKAKEQPNPDKVLQQQAKHNQRLAAQRGQEANKQQKEEAKQHNHRTTKLLKQRQDVIHLEKLRARKVADLPQPQAFKKKIVKEKKPPARVALHEAGTFTTTHYVPQNVRVEKEVWSSKPSAKEKAALEEAERARQEEARQRQAEEERVMREQRGQEALKKEHLTRLLEHLTAGLDEAQRQHHLSHFLHGKEGAVWKSEETRLKEQVYQQKQMEKAVEELLQKEEDEKEEKDKDYLGTGIIPEPSIQSSDYLEEVKSSDDVTLETTSKTRVQGLGSLLKEVERRRNRILQELEDSIPVRGPSGDADGGRLKDQQRDIHMADTVPVHLHRGHTCVTSHPKGVTPDLPPTPPPHPEERSIEAQQDTSETEDSSTVLPLSEESIPVRSDSTQLSTSPSFQPRFSTPQEHQSDPRNTSARRPQPKLSELHSTTSDASSLNSEDIDINIDIDVDNSSLVVSNSSLKQPQQQQSNPCVSSTEYYSLPSDIPGKMSSQEINNNLRRIQENGQRNQRLIDSLSRRRGSPGQQPPNTYWEKLKKDGSGKKPLKRKEKNEVKKKELIQLYIQKLLHRRNQDGEISASTVEGSGLSLSSLGSFLGYLEGEEQRNQSTTSPSVTAASSTSKSLSSYEDIDEFPVKMKPRDCHAHTSSLSSASTSTSSTCSDPHSTTTAITTTTTTGLYRTTTTHPYYHITTTSPSLTPFHPHLSSSTTCPPYHISKVHPESHSSSSTSTSPIDELRGGDSTSISSSGASIAGSPQEISISDERNKKYITPPYSYLTPPREDESSLEDSEIATKPSTTRHTHPCQRLRWQRMRSQQNADTTATSEDSPRGTTTKFSQLSRKNVTDFEFTETIPSAITQTSITSDDSPRGSMGKLSKISWTKMSDIASNEAEKVSISSDTSTTTTQTVSHSSEESSVSMPDMIKVLQRFGLGKANSNSSSATISNEEESGDSKGNGEED